MLSKTGFTHSDLLCWQIDYAGGSLNMNGTIMRDTYICTGFTTYPCTNWGKIYPLISVMNLDD
ncbi:hypothetical protein FOT46_02535 [Citrobacter freundii]|nr:hypothetical protein [Citrobacter freundii]QFX89339.1 hypothetical protein GFB57_12410 [Citrobacter sp. S39]MBE0070582.1 hypothetical protein [Citrobacter freundii]TKI73978.1 hypothetical protein FC759_20385 [Citrobacter freundii]HAU4303331.1 hypothetical protein [Citrobacter freundii]